MEVILASQSPRRKELMGLLGIPFVIKVADIDETMDDGVPTRDAVAKVSRRKAEAIPHQPEDIVIAADTIVVCAGQILGKPTDEADACRILKLLSGKDHQVMTGLTVLRGDQCTVCTEITHVHFRQLTENEILRYIATKEPMDKAGAYGIQGGGALFVDKIEGDYYNVVGLPVCRLGQILRELAPEIMEEVQ
jgi:septum formation protein